MSSDLQKIDTFLQKHHVLTLATSNGEELGACSLFYIFDIQSISFIVASSIETTHIKHIFQNPQVAGAVALETKIIGKIEGIQFRGEFLELDSKELKGLYFKVYPYALAMNPKLWQIKINYFKLTDNALGFGKKIIWQTASL